MILAMFQGCNVERTANLPAIKVHRGWQVAPATRSPRASAEADRARAGVVRSAGLRGPIPTAAVFGVESRHAQDAESGGTRRGPSSAFAGGFGPTSVTQRGNRRCDVFADDADRRLYLSLLGEYGRRHGLSIAAYCLMTNQTASPRLRRPRRASGGHAVGGRIAGADVPRHAPGLRGEVQPQDPTTGVCGYCV